MTVTTNVNRPEIPEIPRKRIVDLVVDMNDADFGVLPGYLKAADLRLPKVLNAFDGFRIILLADLHLHSFTGSNTRNQNLTLTSQ